MDRRLQDAIQLALDQSDESYQPSPGQIRSHVSHRVAKIAADAVTMWFQKRQKQGVDDLAVMIAKSLRSWTRDGITVLPDDPTVDDVARSLAYQSREFWKRVYDVDKN